MSKTADLRLLITAQLSTVSGAVYYRRAPDDAAHPYAVYDLSRVDLGDLSRDDFTLTVDLWDHDTDQKAVDDLADQIEELFNNSNLPQTTILPTFFREARYPVEDPDKDLQHLQLTFLVELYTLPSQEE